ncbi:hypothetical protein ADZ36_18765 [Streptomyces fradiae]|uniref:Uncharacterized protein n=1 Tax=Streptomyces fradiae TaxID=1906 RepID=A0ACC4W910_STRFR|nr:hypothetical protein ADZ36_18765 [Streptomyces fradiae]OFA49699.1 hypothetical protein BEN35_16750 [Streptomyces fradiae]
MSGEPAIEATGLVKSYGKAGREARVVDGVDLRVAPGTVFSLLGPNGAGNPTLGLAPHFGLHEHTQQHHRGRP